MGNAALTAGAHGLLIEVVGSEQDRHGLQCDARQGIPPEVLERIVKFARAQGNASESRPTELLDTPKRQAAK